MRLQVWPNFLTLQVAYQNIEVAGSHQMDTTKWEQPQPLGMGQGAGDNTTVPVPPLQYA